MAKPRKERYVIVDYDVQEREKVWWSNETGWTSYRPDATAFTEAEKRTFYLPNGHHPHWVRK